MKPGLFVSFEGIEGCGKTTQISRLSGLLTERAVPHTITREPGGTAVGESIRKILLNSENINLTSAAELMLFYTSRSQNIQENIKPALDRGDIVICDRFYDASMAYQGYGRGLPLELIEKLTDLVCANYRPDLTILLDIEPRIGLTRARLRNSTQLEDEGRFEAENLSFYKRIREGYLEIAKRNHNRIRTIQGDRSIELVGNDVLAVLELTSNG